MQQSRTHATVLAVLFLALMLAALGMRFWASTISYDFTGPTHIAAFGDDIYLHAAGDLYHLSGSGQLLDVMPPDHTGLSDTPIDLRVLGDGTLLIAETDPASIRICQVEPWQCQPLNVPIASQVKQQFKALYSPAGNDVVFTDADGDMLWKATEGGELRRLATDQTLAGPNDLAFDAAGNLWVADTDHRRIVEFIPQDDGSFLQGREHSMQNSLTVGKRYFPMMLARAEDDRWWVIQAAEFSKAQADVVIYDAEAGVQAVIDLPKGSYPTDIVNLDKAMLVTDMDRLTVYRVDSETLLVSEFGDEDFRSSLLQIGESKKKFERLSTGSLGAIALFAVAMILAAVQATPKHKRWTEPPGRLDVENAPEQVPEVRGIHWLKRDPRWDRTLRWAEPLFYLPVIFAIAASGLLYGWLSFQPGPGPGESAVLKINHLSAVLLLSSLGLLGVIPVLHLQLRNFRQNLGTDGKRLFIRLTDGRQLSVEPSQLLYTSRAVLYRQYTFPLLRAKHKSVFEAGEAETWLAPLLRQARKLTPMEALKHRWNNREGLLLWSLAAGGIMAFVLVVLETISP